MKKREDIYEIVFTTYQEFLEKGYLNPKETFSVQGYDSLMLTRAAGKLTNIFEDEVNIKFEEILNVSLIDNNVEAVVDIIVDKFRKET